MKKWLMLGVILCIVCILAVSALMGSAVPADVGESPVGILALDGGAELGTGVGDVGSVRFEPAAPLTGADPVVTTLYVVAALLSGVTIVLSLKNTRQHIQRIRTLRRDLDQLKGRMRNTGHASQLGRCGA